MKTKKVTLFLLLPLFAALLLAALPVFSFAAPSSLSARSAVLYCPQTGQILFERNANERLGMASTTKIMTAYVTLASLPLSLPVTIPAQACGIEGSSVYLREGETLTVEQLLYALLLRSANDAATALAIAVSGSVEAFAEKMNEAAQKLGAVETHFTNPHGLDDENHYTTASDLALITAAAMENETFCHIVSQTKYTIPAPDNIFRVLSNHNKLLWLYEGSVGVKTGFTKKCGRCLVGAAERNGVRLISVTLKASDDWNDHRFLFDYGFSQVENRHLVSVGEILFSVPLVGGKEASVFLTNDEEVTAILPKNAPAPTLLLDYNRPVTAPVKEGEVIGTIYFVSDGKTVATVSLVAKTTVKARTKK